MRRIVITERNTKGEITSQEVIKPKQLSTFLPLILGRSKSQVKKMLIRTIVIEVKADIVVRKEL